MASGGINILVEFMRASVEAAETQEAKDASTMLFKVAVESLKEAAERDAAFKLVC